MSKKSVWRIPVTVPIMVLMIVALLFVGLNAQQAPPPASRSYSTGTYDAAAYAKWGATIAVGAASGAQTITVCPAFVTLPDGRQFQPLASANGTFAPITVDPAISAVTETVTPTASAVVAPPVGYGPGQCATVTATFSNAHGTGQVGVNNVISGDNGIQEAINDAALANGGPVRFVLDPGIVTLATGAANTNIGAVAIPTRSVVTVASAKVTTTIATCAGGWSLGWSTGTEFTAANLTLTAGTTTDSSTVTLPAVVAAATIPVVHCTTSNASAGAVHAHIEGYKNVAPAN
jgi:hypothetical protein